MKSRSRDGLAAKGLLSGKKKTFCTANKSVDAKLRNEIIVILDV